jgi:hypothetical protein
MDINPTIYIVIGVIGAAVSVASAVVTGILEHRQKQANEQRLREQSKNVTQAPPSNAANSPRNSVSMPPSNVAFR